MSTCFGRCGQLAFSLKTDRYRQWFMDAYGRERIDEDRLRVAAAAEVLG